MSEFDGNKAFQVFAKKLKLQWFAEVVQGKTAHSIDKSPLGLKEMATGSI